MIEANIKAALIRFTTGIKNSDGAAIAMALNDVEELTAAHREELHPQLVHFLEGRCYAKALAYLGGVDALTTKPSSPPGGCSNHGT